MDLKHLIHTGELIEKGLDASTKKPFLVNVISTDDPDHDGDIILPKGVKLDKYTKKVLWSHDLSGKTLPFGRSMWEKADSTGRKFLQKVEAPPFEKLESAEALFIKDLWALTEAGILNEWSISFADFQAQRLTQKDFDLHSHWKGGSRLITSCDLVEVSLVKVGNNWNTDVIERAAKDLKIDPLTFKSLGIVPPVEVTQVSVGVSLLSGAPQTLDLEKKALEEEVPEVEEEPLVEEEAPLVVSIKAAVEQATARALYRLKGGV